MAQFNALARRYGEEQRRLDYRPAIICAIIAEVYRDRKKRPKPFTPSDFMPRERPKAMDATTMKQAMRQINQMLGGEEK